MDAASWLSKIGFHVRPASVVFHTPPATAPKYAVSGSPGTPAAVTSRPPRNGPIMRQRIPEYNADSGDAASAAAEPNREQNDALKSAAASAAARRVNMIFMCRRLACGTVPPFSSKHGEKGRGSAHA